MSALFRPATREKIRLRMAIDGPSGSGKTFTALRCATALGQRIAIINSESGAVQKYLGLAPDGIPFQFDICEISDHAPTKYTEAILAAGAAGYDCIIIDSLSHAWAGSGGALELKDRQGGNSFVAWKNVSPMHARMIDAILHSPSHVIATMRSKTEYIIETDDRGRAAPRKVGMAPVQRAGVEYEFDLYCSLDAEHIMKVTKSRCPDVADVITVKPGMSFMAPVVSWLNDGSNVPAERFAVTEADLAKLAKAESADLPPAPKKTAAELMAEAAAKVEAQTTAAPAQTTAATLQITEGQCRLIVSLFDQLGTSVADRQKVIAKRGVSTLAEFNFEQGGELIAGLEKKLAEAKAKAASSLVTSTTSSTLDASGAATGEGISGIRTKEPRTATVDQVAAIKSAMAEWEQVQPGVSADFVARLQSSGFQKIADLSYADAADLLSAVEVKNIANFFEQQLTAKHEAAVA